MASIPPKGAYYWLYEAFEQERFEWAISNEILTEYDEKLSERYSSHAAHLVLTILTFAPNALFSEPYYNWQLIEADPDDNKFADLAIEVGPDYLVTNDGHFNILKDTDFPKVTVVENDDFWFTKHQELEIEKTSLNRTLKDRNNEIDNLKKQHEQNLVMKDQIIESQKMTIEALQMAIKTLAQK